MQIDQVDNQEFTPSAGRVNPFGVIQFLTALGDYCGGWRLEVDGNPYLSESFIGRGRPGTFTWVELKGAGVADFMDLDWDAVSPEQFLEFVESLWGHAQTTFLVLPRVTNESKVGQLVSGLAATYGLPLAKVHYDIAPYARLEDDWEDFYTQKGRKFRYNLRRSERKLDEIGHLSYQHVSHPDEVAHELPDVFELYSRRSQQRYVSPLWGTTQGREVLLRSATEFARLGWLDLTLLKVADRTVAFAYGIATQEDYFFYATAFDPEEQFATYSPGTLIIKHLLERAHQNGLRRFDFMLGDEPYKWVWATDSRPVYTYVLGQRSPRSHAAFRAYCLWLHSRQRVRNSRRLRSIAQRFIR